MSWAGSNPYAALSAPAKQQQQQHQPQTQREEPKPKKNLAKAKDASKVQPKEEPKKVEKKVDPKAGTGNNSAKPNRPERSADRKGRTFPKKSGTGRNDTEKRDGKDWGEGRKKIEDGEAEAATDPERTDVGQEPRVRTEGEERRRNGRRGRDNKDKVVEELTPEEAAALQAEKEAEARQMTIEEWNAKKTAAADSELKAELKEVRKVDAEEFKKLQQVNKKIENEWGATNNNKKQNKKNQKKKEIVPLSDPAAQQQRQGKKDGRDRERKGGKGERAPQLKLDDQNSFPSLGAPAAKK